MTALLSVVFRSLTPENLGVSSQSKFWAQPRPTESESLQAGLEIYTFNKLLVRYNKIPEPLLIGHHHGVITQITSHAYSFPVDKAFSHPVSPVPVQQDDDGSTISPTVLTRNLTYPVVKCWTQRSSDS